MTERKQIEVGPGKTGTSAVKRNYSLFATLPSASAVTMRRKTFYPTFKDGQDPFVIDYLIN